MPEMTADAMSALASTVRDLRVLLQADLANQLERRFRLSVAPQLAGLDEERLTLRRRLEQWLHRRARARLGSHGACAAEAITQVRRSAESEMAARTILRLILLRQLEACGVCRPAVLTGGWASKGYLQLRHHAPGLLNDEHEGLGKLLELLYDELAVDLPGLYGKQPLDAYFTVSPAALRETVIRLNAPELDSAWLDDTTAGWVYQFYNDPEREAIDERIGPRGKVTPAEIASKTQLFTESYMVQWLLQNSVGRIYGKMRAARAGSAVAEPPWPLYVRGGAEPPLAELPEQLSELRILDPACGSGHFLAGAFDLLVPLYRQQARDGGQEIADEEIVQCILSHNLHGIDIDARAVQVAAAVLYLKARRLVRGGRIPPMNLVATSFDLDGLAADDPAIAALNEALAAGSAGSITQLKTELQHVSYRGSLLRFEAPVTGPQQLLQQAHLEKDIEGLAERHGGADDLGVRFDGTQLAAGLRLRNLLRDGSYDVVVFNPPYLATSKIDLPPEELARAFGGEPDIFSAFVARAFELCKPAGLIAFVALSNWMFLSSFQGVRERLLQGRVLLLADLGKGAFRRASKLIQTAMVIATPSRRYDGISLAARIGSRDAISATQAEELAQALTVPSIYRSFEPELFAGIDGAPLLFWLDEAFLRRYPELPKVGEVADGAGGIATTDNARFLRALWEVSPEAAHNALAGAEAGAYVPYIKGAKGREWIEPWRWLLRAERRLLELKVLLPNVRVALPEGLGVAYTTIGQRFGARLHTVPSVRDVSGASFFPGPAITIEALVCALNRTLVRELACALNPTINFQLGDVRRLPAYVVDGAERIVPILRAEFAAAEQANELSLAYRRPGPNAWQRAIEWAQQAVDRPAGAPLPPYEPEHDEPEPKAFISFGVGVALGRFGAGGEGIVADPPAKALPAGLLFVSATPYKDSLAHPACSLLHEAWQEHGATVSGKHADLNDYLRRGFFPEDHRGRYDNRPIYFPLSSAKRSFVAYASIHRWQDDTLQVLLADHLVPERRRLEGEIEDLRKARADQGKKGKAEKRFAEVQKLLAELNDFIAAVTEIADQGPPPPDARTPPRDEDARFVMDLDDGVMVNSAALWPLLEPQWRDPKRWWKELCTAKGRKDYDWSQLAARYFPARVAGKCAQDPSLAVAHRCFWRLWPEQAYAWELRLQAESRPDFTIDEPGSDEARRALLAEQPERAAAILAAEHKRRERQAGKAAGGESSDGPLFDGRGEARS